MAWCTPKIEFDREIFFPGQEVTGKVSVTTTKEMTARGVRITFTGKSLATWDSNGKDRPVEGQMCKKGEEIHVEMSHNVWEPETDENKFPAGEYEWQFQFELPKECPPSFEGVYGFIRYFVQVHIDVPHWIDTRVERAVTVSPTIDLNSIPGAGEAARLESEAAAETCGCFPLHFWPFKRGNVGFTITSPYLGYVSGQSIAISALLDNHSTKPICEVVATLQRTATFREDLKGSVVRANVNVLQSDDRFTSKKQTVQLAQREVTCNVASGGSKTFDFSFQIPPTVATIRSSRFVSVEYFVTVTAKLDSFLCDESHVDFFFIVGNVPLLEAGKTSLPPHSFEKGDEAKCWTSFLKPKFTPQFPYYGMKKLTE